MLSFFSINAGAPPNFGADIVFLADSSVDVSQSDFTKQKSMVKLMANLLNIHSLKSRAAFVTYGNTANVVTSFLDYGSIAAFERFVMTKSLCRINVC